MQHRTDPSVLAVVVSYNRVELLRRALQALLSQSRPLDGVLVVDNASTDGSADMVRTEFPDVLLYETGANIGGAGGFAWSVEIACALGFDAAWLMDDDAAPERTALEALLGADERQRLDSASFLASIPVAPDLELGQANHPAVDHDFRSLYSAASDGMLPITRASFVGVLINLAVARRVGLPNRDFFIWGDDNDFTSRLSAVLPAYAVLTSLIVHDSPAMQALAERRSVGWKYTYLVRNSLWEARWTTDRLYRRFKIRKAIHGVVTEIRDCGPTPALLSTTVRAAADGLLAPRTAYPVGSLLAGDARAASWVSEVRARAAADRTFV